MRKSNNHCVKQFWKRNPEKRAFYNLKYNAKRRGIYFDITMSEWLDFCKRTNYHKYKGRKPDSLTIDRIFTSKGYTISNIQVLTLADNVKKQREFEYYENQIKGLNQFTYENVTQAEGERIPF